MQIRDLFRPKWKQSDKELRLKAVNDMKADRDAETLIEVASTDPEEDVRVAAVKKISDIETLERLASEALGDKPMALIAKKLDDHYREKIIASSGSEWEGLIDKITRDETLAVIALKTQNVPLRTAAIEKIASQEALLTIAVGKCGKDAGMKAVARIVDEELLVKVKENGANKAVRRAAERKVEEMHPPEPPSQEELNAVELTAILEYAESITETYNFEGVGRLLDEKKARWAELDPQAQNECAARFNEIVEQFNVRRKDFEEKNAAKLQHEQEQKALADKKAEICTSIEELNAQSEGVAEAYNQLKEQWAELDTLEDDDQESKLALRFAQACGKCDGAREKLADEQSQFDRLKALCEELEGIVEKNDPAEIKRRARAKCPKVSLELFDATEWTTRIEQAIAKIREKADEARRAAEEERKKRSEELDALLASAKEQVEAEDRRAAGNKMREIQEKWNNLGGWNEDSLVAEFRKLLDAFWEKQREFMEEREWAEWANKGIKEELITMVEKTGEIEDLPKVAKIIRAAQKKWKETGPVPRDVSQDMWQRFHDVCEKNYARCKEFFDEKDQVRESNYSHCVKLCEEAEKIADSEDWGATVKRMKELQADWKKHGELPRDRSEELYARFRAICDKFFGRLDAHHQEVDGNRDDNQKRKDELIAKIEGLVEAGDFSSAKPCIEVQEEWKATGPGIREKDEETWKRFRAGCDTYFAKMEERREENVPLKEALCEEAEKLLAELNDDTDRKAMGDKIQALQKRWKEIGPLPKKKQKSLWNRFRTSCDKFFDIRREEYESQAEEREANLKLKEELIEQAEAVSDSTDWRETADFLKDLQAKWKAIGPVPREHDREVWNRFRTACDAFFSRRKENFDRNHQQRLDNLKAKEELLARLEQIVGKDEEKEEDEAEGGLDLADQLQVAFATNFAMAGSSTNEFEEVRSIQEQWKSIGYIPREKDKEIWGRYKALLDRFYEARRR